jgi:hypothetical protein
MKNINQKAIGALHRTQRFLRKYKEPIFAGLAAIFVLSTVTLAIAPGNERVYKSEITGTVLRTQNLNEQIELWEKRITEAKREIAQNNRRIMLLSEVFNPQK